MTVAPDIADRVATLTQGGVRQILVVCTANQCRSPMAEGLIRQRVAAAGSDGLVRVASAGTWAQDGLPATPTAVAVMAEQGIDIGPHRSREVTAGMLADADLILVMTRGHAESLAAEFPEAAGRILLFSALGGGAHDIADPVGQPAADYRRTAAELAGLVERGWSRILGGLPA